jgi:GT2 family glycosyltransferase/glycosyltransferase involved in cell wall biosynthesis
MPTANRRRWVAQSIRYFLRQDYPNRELVILDDGDDAVGDLVPADARIRYKRISSGHTLGTKQNRCVEESRGDLILHWDDDDWFAAHRIRTQVEALQHGEGEICGLSRMLFHDLPSGRTWLYEFPERRWLAGGSLLYTREFWRRAPFPDVQVGADTLFIWSHSLDGAVALDDYEIYVAMIHGGNTSPKVGQESWTPWHGDLRRIMGDDFAFYDFARAAAAGMRIGWIGPAPRGEIEALRALGHEVFVYTPEMAREAAAADRVDHLHGNGSHSATRLVAETLGIPFTVGIASEKSLFTDEGVVAVRAIADSPRCAGIAAENAFIHERLVSRCGVERQRIAVIPSSLDLGVYRVAATRPRGAPIRILTVMRTLEREALARLVAAFRDLSRRRADVELWLAGADEPDLRAAATAHPSIAYLGPLSDDDCRAAYARASIFCLPCERIPRSDGEEPPIALLEAMAFELPVVTTSLLSLAHYVRDGEEGLLAPPRDSSALADCLERLCDDDELRLAMGRRARLRVEQIGDVATNAAQLVRLFGRPSPDPPPDLPIHSIAGGTAPRAEIIVPTFGQEHYTVRCFDSLLACTSSYRLVWVDNGSQAASRAVVDAAFEKHQQRLALWPDQNLGFVGGTNLGLRAVLGQLASDAEYIVLLNNDTEVTPGWLDRLIGALEADPSIAAAGPMTSPPSPCQAWPAVFADLGTPPPAALHDASPAEAGRALAEIFGDAVWPVPMIAFFCTVFRKRVFSEVGLLDPRFGAGLGDDDDYCFRLRAAGHRVAFVPGAYVVHRHRTTFRTLYSESEIAAMQHENYAKYRAKHAIGDAAEPGS